MGFPNILKEEVNKISTHPLQTWEWGEFRKEWGNEVLKTKYGIIIVNRLPLGFGIGTFIKGPMPTKAMLKDLTKIGKENNLIYIKLEPNYVIKKGNIACADEKKATVILREADAVPGKTLFTPTSFWIDLSRPEDALMKSFSSKTRYNIRLAERKGVVVTEDNSDKAFNIYLKLTQETVERQGFYAHTKRYHQLMWKHLKKAGIAKLLVAKYQKEIITTWIIFLWKDFVYYPYGASSARHKNVMANNLMMWEAIKLGKKLGAKTFDLWGREPGKGFTKFKEGYNPEVVEFVGTWDLVINKPAYYVFRIAEPLRWVILRGKSKFSKPKF